MTDNKPDSTIEVRIDGNKLGITHPRCAGVIHQKFDGHSLFWELECGRCNRKWWISTFGETERLWEVANSGDEQDVTYKRGTTPDASTAFVAVRQSK